MSVGDRPDTRRCRRSRSECVPVSEVARDPRPPYIAVIGDGEPRGPDAHRILEWAEEVGLELARAGATVVTGGLGGVMEAASRGARSAGGVTIGILPGADASEANEFVSIPIATGLGVVRNLVVVTSANAVVAVGGRHGTLSEIGLALRMGRHVVALSSWRVESEHRLGGPRVHRVRDPREAASLALRLAAAAELNGS
ncbi:MAG: TIGR00725 family protein [Gemmatimonadaceae bacterium]|nr:TIGR00725 family protein [Gemmatimonadaceae bacterium]